MLISNVRLLHPDSELTSKLWSVDCVDGKVRRVQEVSERLTGDLDAKGGIMIPSLCHPHIHLDKCFILGMAGLIVEGDFKEAMRLTSTAKGTFNHRDLYDRGERLIRESIEWGVTSMRAHVEVDEIVRFSCLDVALELRKKYEAACDIQIAVFAQEPLFMAPGDTTPGPNYELLREAVERDEVHVVGSAPYVEPTIVQAKKNIALILGFLDSRRVENVDFHLDYNLDPQMEPLIYEVIAQARGIHIDKGAHRDSNAAARGRPTITIGHATRLQLLSAEEWTTLARELADLPINIALVSLPQSDLYMQGRSDEELSLGAPRGTLRVTHLYRKYGLQVAMGVNNVQNAFTPQGSLDPLSLCTLGVAIFQAARARDIDLLIRSVTLNAKTAINHERTQADLFPTEEDPADFVILHTNDSFESVVLNPSLDRTTIRAGVVVASKKSVATWSM